MRGSVLTGCEGRYRHLAPSPFPFPPLRAPGSSRACGVGRGGDGDPVVLGCLHLPKSPGLPAMGILRPRVVPASSFPLKSEFPSLTAAEGRGGGGGRVAFLHWPGMLRWHRAGAEPRLLYRGVSPEVGTGTGTGGGHGATVAFVFCGKQM